MKEIKYNDLSKDVLNQLPKGAFITVMDKAGRVNTMTIGWGSVGFMWGKPIFTALVRQSRHTFDLLENSDNFTISFPLNSQLKQELITCGTKSGRNIDKFGSLKLMKSKVVSSPAIQDCDLHFECKCAYKQLMDKSFLCDEFQEFYTNDDMHKFYFGEILTTYLK